MISGIPSSTLAVYAVVAIARMSNTGKPVSGSYLANAFGLKSRTFEPVLQRLSRAGIITSVRGHSGGYLLNDCGQITVADVLKASELSLANPKNSLKSPVVSAVSKVVDPCFEEGQKKLLQYYATIRIADMVNELAKAGQTLLPEEWMDFSI